MRDQPQRNIKKLRFPPIAPIWLNPYLSHIYKISDPYAWTKYNIELISQIVLHNYQVPLSQLSSTNNVPNYYQFCYLQLSHAFAAQFPHSSCMVVQSGLERTLRSECAQKPTFHVYAHLVFVSLTPLEGLWCRWQRNIHALDNEDWDDIWDFPFRPLVSVRDHLVQFKIVHRAYYTPHRLHKMNAEHSSECWRCGTSPVDFSHIFWYCPEVQKYWTEVLALINLVASVSIQPSMEVCLLRLLENILPTVARRTLIGLLLFMPGKTQLCSGGNPLPHLWFNGNVQLPSSI